MPSTHHALQALRVEIDRVDGALLELLSRRARVVARIALVKEELGLPTLDPTREAALLLDRVSQNHGPLRDSVVVHLFGEILAVSRDVMEETRRAASTAREHAGELER